jgi:hypothetical protein
MFNGTDNTIYASAAPGLTPANEAGEEQAPGQRLPTSGAQTELNRVTGHRYAFQNNPNTDIVFEFIENDDIYEPALMQPFTYQESMGNVAGTTVNKRFIPRSVSITHSNRVGEKSKRVVVTAYGETSGDPGDTKPVPVYDTDNPPVLIEPNPIGTTPVGGQPSLMPYDEDTFPTKMFIAAATSAQAAIATEITLGGTFIWTEISTGLTGNGIWASSDPFDYSRIFLLTTTGLYTCTPYSFSGWTLVANNATIFGNSARVGQKIVMSINRRGWIYLTSGESMCAWSSNYGVTWTNNGGTAGTGTSPYNQDVVVSPYNDGSSAVGWMYRCLYTGSGLNTIYKSTDWGQNWTSLGTKNLWAWLSGRLNIPYKKSDGSDNINDTTQLLYVACGAGHSNNGGAIHKSEDAGVSWSGYYTAGGNAIYVPATSYGGSSIQTFTYDGGVVLCGNLLTGAGGGTVGLFVQDDATVIANAGHISAGSSYLNSACVNGFSYSRLAALFWNQVGVNAELNYSIDGGLTVYNVNLPSFFTGSPKLIGYAEWPLIDFVIG